MKLSNDTLNILKNFSVINPSLWITPGNVMKTITPTKTVYSKATIDETFPVECGLYELNKFLGVLSLFKDPDLEFSDKFVEIISDKQKVKYVYCEKEMMNVAPSKDIVFPSVDESFHLTKENLLQLFKAVSVLQLPQISFKGDGTNITVEGTNQHSGMGDNYSIIVGETTKTFCMNYEVGNLKFMPQDYLVDISSKKITRLTSDKILYLIAAESTSKFEE